jgi:hypothetical protein
MALTSVLSFPERGPYGRFSWPGNTSGFVIRALLQFFRPRLFVDPAMGSNTSGDVARELGVDYVGLDLHAGFNLLKDCLRDRLNGREACYVFLHPPYHDMHRYSGNVWGSEPHPDDLSRCASYEEFIEKLQFALQNIYDAVRKGGRYTVQIGDMRRKGRYMSIQADLIAIAPGELESVLVKVQHNTRSESTKYSGSFIPIAHEYILTFRKDGALHSILDCSLKTSMRLVGLSNATWKAVVQAALQKLGGQASLQEIYDVIAREASEKAMRNPNWKAKVRQILQQMCSSIKRGVWKLQASAA